MFTDLTEPLSILLCLSNWSCCFFIYNFLNKKRFIIIILRFVFTRFDFIIVLKCHLCLKWQGKGVVGSCLEISVGVVEHRALIWCPVWFISQPPSHSNILGPMQNRMCTQGKAVVAVRWPLITVEQVPRNICKKCAVNKKHSTLRVAGAHFGSFSLPFYRLMVYYPVYCLLQRFTYCVKMNHI